MITKAWKILSLFLDLRRFNWIFINQICKTNFIKLSPVFSVFGYMIIYNEKLRHYFELTIDSKSEMVFPIIYLEDRLNLYFFSFFCFFIFSLIARRMDPIISNYNSVWEYAELRTNAPFQTLVSRCNELKTQSEKMPVQKYESEGLKKSIDTQYGRLIGKNFEMKNLKDKEQHIVANFVDDAKKLAQDIHQKYYWRISHQFPIFRIFCMIFVISGTAMIGIITFDIIAAVVERLIVRLLYS